MSFTMNTDDELYQSTTPGGSSSGWHDDGQSREEVAQSGYPGATPPGLSEPSTASTPAWQPSYTKGSSWQGWQPQGHVSEFKVDTRNWKGAHLDLDAKPEGFQAWRDRARVHLSGSRLDVRRLLQWAEKSTGPLDAAAEQRGANESGLVDDVTAVSFALHGGLSFIVSDALMTVGRTCGDSGMEFWRQLTIHSYMAWQRPAGSGNEVSPFQLSCSMRDYGAALRQAATLGAGWPRAHGGQHCLPSTDPGSSTGQLCA